jgi:endonuclease/exonuclease/phosphatase family metal-dependent hydrolase
MNAPCPLPPLAGGALIDDEAWPTGVQVALVIGGGNIFRGMAASEQGKAAREEGVKLLIEKIHEIAGKKAPAIVGGDFNTPVDSPIFKPLTKYMVSARAKAATTDHKGTFNGFGSAPDTIVIDHLYYRGKLKCQLFATLDGNYGAPYISDHYPIAMVFTL